LIGLNWWLVGLAGCPAAHRYPDGSELAGQLEREVIALMHQKAILQEQLAGCRPIAPTLSNPLGLELQQVFLGSDVELRRRGDVVGVSVRASVLFSDPFATTFRAEAQPVLDLLNTAVSLHPELHVWIIGHTSDRPIPKAAATKHQDHLDLSVHLAEALARDFVRRGAAPAQLVVAGRGPSEPVGSNDVDAGRDANARVELWFVEPNELLR
jgi:flagellar motor protein MotB